MLRRCYINVTILWMNGGREMSIIKEELKKRKRQKRIKIAGISVITIILIVIGVFGFQSYKESEFLKNVKLQGIKVDVKKVKHTKSNIFSSEYQEEAQKQIDALKKKKAYTEENPLVIENPYGTNTSSLYFYAKTERESYVVCTIESKGASTLKNTLENGKKNRYEKVHEYEITGLVPGAKNRITLEYYNEDGKAVAKKYFEVKTKKDDSAPEILEKKQGSSKAMMKEGLFAMFGWDKGMDYNIYLYDNKGVNRGKMPLNRYRNDRFLFVDGEMLYCYESNKIAFRNRLGKITKTIILDGYKFHHDMVYSEKYNKIVCLVNDKKKDTIEDVVLIIDIKTGKIDKKIDFEDFLGEMKDNAYRPEKNAYGGEELDWLHLNSLDFVTGDSIIFSSREQSTLIKVDNIFGNPTMDYLIHGGSLYDETSYDNYLLKQEGSFVPQSGQHTITVEKSSSLKDGQYYLYMFNNNYANALTIPGFDWSLYPGAGTFEEGSASKYYKYLVDEEKRTYKLVDSFDLPYSSIVSSVQHFDGNIPFSSGMSKTFGEYDAKGKLIYSFEYKAEKYSYRVMKYNFKGYWYR